MKKERPILFSTLMVRALLAGRKTQTRRIIKPQPKVLGDIYKDASKCYRKEGAMFYWQESATKCPYGQVGDILWVRETFVSGQVMKDQEFVYDEHDRPITKTWYCADGDIGMWFNGDTFRENVPWKPSIYMPKIAARIWLEVTDIRVERVSDLSEEDAIAEGVERIKPKGEMSYKSYVVPDGGKGVYPYVSFLTLWQSINGRESWDANPWVWVVSFKVLSTTGKPENI